jgi:hypothetical protein
MSEKKVKENLDSSGYVLGVLSIIFGVLSPLAGLVIGIVGVNFSKGDSGLAKRARKLSKIGIIISILVLILSVYLASRLNGLSIPGY